VVSCIIDDSTCIKVFSNDIMYHPKAMIVMIDAYRSK
jgi:hypothetical protein